MATLILPALVSLAPEGVALTGAALSTALTQQAVLAAIGSYIDNAFIFPALFPPDTAYGPRLDDQNVSSAKEGSPKNICIGPECRTDGQIIWCSPIREYKDEEAGGGKGGQSGNYVTYKYYCHVALGICENQISQVKKIWADGKQLYSVAPDLTVTLNANSVGVYTKHHGWTPTGGDSYTQYWTHILKITCGIAGPDVHGYVSGKIAVLSGFADPLNNGNIEVFQTGTEFDGHTWISFRKVTDTSTSVFAAFAAPGNATSTIFQDAPAFSLKQVGDIIFHDGSETQLPDPLIESIEGPGNVPGYRGIAYVIFQDLALQDYGNRIPNFTFLVEADTSITLGNAIARILASSGMDAGLYDVSAIQDQNLRGITLSGPQAPISELQPIMIAYDVAAQLRDGVLTFVYRKDLPVFPINVADMSARFGGEISSIPFRLTDKIDYELNSNVTVEYMDPEKDYQTGTQTFVPANPAKPNPGSFSFPLTFSSDEARALAERLFWLQYASRQEVSFTLPPSYIYLREGDNVTFTYNGANYQVLIKQIDRGQQSQFLVISGTIEDQSILTRVVTSEGPSSFVMDPALNQGYPQALHWNILDIPALKEEHLSRPGFYIAAISGNPTIPFGGAHLYESADGGGSYKKVDTIYFQASMGYCTTVLSLTAVADYWDDVSSLTVVMMNGTLSSCTEQQCLNGDNRMQVGREIIGFMNATLVDTNTYTLTHLLRGLRGTETRIAEHLDNEEVTYLNGPGLAWHDLTMASVGQTRYYKLVPIGDFVELEEPKIANPSGATLRAFAPASIDAVKDGSNNVTISFTPRSRALVVDFMPQSTPFMEERDIFKVDIYAPGSPDVYKRTLTSADYVHSVVYTSAQQTADGFTPGSSSIKVQIGQKYYRTSESAKAIATRTPRAP